MRITFFTPKLLYGGVEVLLLNTIKGLKKRYGHDIQVVSILPSESSFYNQLPNDVKVSFAFKKDNKKDNKNILGKLLYYFETELCTGRISRLVTKTKPDVIICYVENYDTIHIASKLSNPQIVYVHNIVERQPTNCKHDEIVIKQYRQDLKKVDKFFYVSESCKNAFSALYDISPDKQEVIYNYTPIHQIQNLSVAFDLTPKQNDHIRLCYAGRLEEEKGVLRLIRSCLRLLKSGYKIEVYIVGSGKLEQECRDLINEHCVDDIIHLIGFCDNPYPYLANSDWYVCASRKESFGLSVLEAIMLGTKVISTRSYGTEDIIKLVGGGILVDNSEEALYQGLRDILEGKIICPPSHDLYKYFDEETFFNKLEYELEKVITDRMEK